MAKKLKNDPSRREFLVTMSGKPVGTFLLPKSIESAAKPGAAPNSPPTLDLFMQPSWGKLSGRFPYLMYQPSGGSLMMWQCMSPDPNDPVFLEMVRFYEACGNPGCPEVNAAEVFPIERSAEEAERINAILADLGNDQAKLAYGLWLKSQENLLGDFIEACVQLNLISQEDEHWQPFADFYNEYADMFWRELFRPLAALGLWPTVGGTFIPQLWADKGVIFRIEVNISGVLPERTNWLFQAAPTLTEMTLQFENWDIPAIVAQPELGQITKLEFKSGLNATVTADDLQAIAQSPNLGGLKSLRIFGCKFGDGISRLEDSALISQLVNIDFCACAIGDEPAAKWIANNDFSQLETLSTLSNGLGKETVTAFAKKEWPRLRHLDISSNAIGDAGVDLLLQTDLPALTGLNFNACKITAESIALLMNWPGLPQMERLSLGNNELGDDIVTRLMQCEALGELRELILVRTCIGSQTVHAIANCERFANLRTLDLSHNAIGSEGTLAISQSPILQGLEQLLLSDCGIGEEEKTALRGVFEDRVHWY